MFPCETLQCEEFVISKVLVCASCANGGQGETEGITLADAAQALTLTGLVLA